MRLSTLFQDMLNLWGFITIIVGLALYEISDWLAHESVRRGHAVWDIF